MILTFELRASAGGRLAEARSYFAARAGYALRDGRLQYVSEDTEVTFVVQIDQAASALSLEVPYARPHVFGLEVEREVAAVTRALGLVAYDARGALTPLAAEEVRRAYAMGNAAACAGLPASTPSLPAGKLERVWGWNVRRRLLDESSATAATIPKVHLVRDVANDEILSSVVWRSYREALLPLVDVFVLVLEGDDPMWISRDDLARTGLPSELRPAAFDYGLLDPVVGLDHLATRSVPEAVQARIREKARREALRPIPFAEVMTRELLPAPARTDVR